MGQVSVFVKIDPTRGRRTINADEYKGRKQVNPKGAPFHLQKKKGYMGENVSTTPDFTEEVHRGVTGVRP